MPLEPAPDHARVDIAAQAQLQPESAAAAGPGPARGDDFAADGVADVDDVAEAVGPPRSQQHEQLGVGRAGLGLGEVKRDAQPGDAPRGLERGLQRLDPAARRVAAQVDADDAGAGLEPRRGEGDDVGGLGGGVAAVDGEDEAGVHAGVGAGGALVFGDGGQDGVDVVGLGDGGAGQGARGGAKLEIDDAVGGEGLEDGEGGVPEGGEVVDEVVDVGGEEGKEAGARCGVSEQVGRA